MYAILKFKHEGYEIKANDNKLIFEDLGGCHYIFDLKNKKVMTNIVYNSNEKRLNSIINQMKKELGWEDDRK